MAYSSQAYSLISKGYNTSREKKVQEKQAATENKTASIEPSKQMNADEMQEALILLSKAVVELTDKINAMEKGNK